MLDSPCDTMLPISASPGAAREMPLRIAPAFACLRLGGISGMSIGRNGRCCLSLPASQPATKQAQTSAY
jgi:hypothetical protein